MIDCRYNHEYMTHQVEVFKILGRGDHKRIAEMVMTKPRISEEHRRFYCEYLCGYKCITTGGERKWERRQQIII